MVNPEQRRMKTSRLPLDSSYSLPEPQPIFLPSRWLRGESSETR